MKRISYWAYRKPVYAQTLIFLIHLYLIFAAMTIAGWMQATALTFLALPVLIAAIAALALGLGFHKWIKAKRLPRGNGLGYYGIRLSYLLIAVASFFTLISFYASNTHVKVNQSSALYSSFVAKPLVKDGQQLEKPDYRKYTSRGEYFKDLNAWYKSLSQKELKAERKKLIRSGEFRQADGSATIWHVLLILGVLLALYLLFALACSLSCNGQDILAIIVAVLGLAGIIWGTIALWKLINRNRDRKRTNAPAPAG